MPFPAIKNLPLSLFHFMIQKVVKRLMILLLEKKSCGYAEMVISGPRLPNLKVKRRGGKGENSFHFFINFFILRLCN